MITLMDAKTTDYTSRGLCTLTPISCTITETAGGQYELEMEHPLDSYGKWKLLKKEMLIKAPIPETYIPRVVLPVVALWRVKSTVTQTPLYSKLPGYVGSKSNIIKRDSEIYTSAYNWSSGATYSAGTYVIRNAKIYQAARNWVPGYPVPGADEYYWNFVGDIEGGSSGTSEQGKFSPGTVAEQLAGGETITTVADYNSSYMQVRSIRGKTGYVAIDDCELVSDNADPIVIPAHTITEQVFRIYSVSYDSDSHTITVAARHKSYDLRANCLFDCAVTDETPNTAISLMRGALVNEDIEDRIIACDMDEPKITADWSFANPVIALLDPDSGLAGRLKAKVIRDNDDYYILDDSEPETGIRIAYGENLRGVTWEKNIENVVTRVIPRASDGKSGYLYLEELYIDSPHINDYAVIWTQVLDSQYSVGQEIEKADGTKEKLDDATVLEKMREEAQNIFDVDHADLETVELDVEFLLLGDSAEYKQFKGLQKLKLYDKIHIITGESDMDVEAQVSGYEWDAILRMYNKITIGKLYRLNRHVTGYMLAQNSVGMNQLTPAAVSTLKAAGDVNSSTGIEIPDLGDFERITREELEAICV